MIATNFNYQHPEESETFDLTHRFTAEDMLSAFRHGRVFEDLKDNLDVDPAKLPEKNRAFWEWLKLKYQ